MANLQRLTERVKKMEEWVKENEELGGPQGTLDTFNFLISESSISPPSDSGRSTLIDSSPVHNVSKSIIVPMEFLYTPLCQ